METLQQLTEQIEALDGLRIELNASQKHPDLHRDIEAILASMQKVNERIASMLNPIEGGMIESEKSENDPLGIIGRKCKGFRFEEGHGGISFPSLMERHIGVVGVVWRYSKESKSYSIDFGGNDQWNYPADLISEHLC